MRTQISSEFQRLLAERERYQAAAMKIEERARRIADERAAVERELTDAHAAQRDFEASVADAIASGTKMPEPTAAMRTSQAKATGAQQKIAALDAAARALHQEVLETHAAAGEIKDALRVERAQCIGAAYLAELAKLRDLVDEQGTRENAIADLTRAMFDASPQVATGFANAAEKARIEWVLARNDRVIENGAKRARELLAGIPS